MSRWGKPTKNKRSRTIASVKYRLDEEEDFTMRTDAQGGGRREWKDLVGNLASRLGDHWFYKVKPSGTPFTEWVSSSDPKRDEVVREWLMGYPNWFGTGEDTPLDDPAVEAALQQAIQIAPSLASVAEPKGDDGGARVDTGIEPYVPGSFKESVIRKSSDEKLQGFFNSFHRYLKEGFAMGSDSRHPNPGRPNVDQLNVAELGPQQWLEAVLNEPFTSTSMGSGGGVGTDNTTTLAQMFQDGNISDSNDMQRHLEDIMYEDGMPDDEIQAILTHLPDAMYENGLV